MHGSEAARPSRGLGARSASSLYFIVGDKTCRFIRISIVSSRAAESHSAVPGGSPAAGRSFLSVIVFTVKLSQELVRRLRVFANGTNLSLSEIVSRALLAALPPRRNVAEHSASNGHAVHFTYRFDRLVAQKLASTGVACERIILWNDCCGKPAKNASAGSVSRWKVGADVGRGAIATRGQLEVGHAPLPEYESLGGSERSGMNTTATTFWPPSGGAEHHHQTDASANVRKTLATTLQSLQTGAMDQAKYLQLSESLDGFRSKLRARAKTLNVCARQQIVRRLIKEILVDDKNLAICHSIPISPVTPIPKHAHPLPSSTPSITPQTPSYPLRWGSSGRSLRKPCGFPPSRVHMGS
jgi:hypothetical protein